MWLVGIPLMMKIERSIINAKQQQQQQGDDGDVDEEMEVCVCVCVCVCFVDTKKVIE
jgi:hypothetical protein